MPHKSSIPHGLCHCGCGQKTKLAGQTDTRLGHVAGKPLKYIYGHFRSQVGGGCGRKRALTEDQEKELVRMYVSDGWGYWDLASHFGVSPGTACRCVARTGLSDDLRKRIVSEHRLEAAAKVWADPVRSARIRMAVANPARGRKIAEALRGGIHTALARKHMAEAQQLSLQDPEVMASRRRAAAAPERRRKIGQASKLIWKTSARREQHTLMMKRFWADPVWRKSQLERLTASWMSATKPELRMKAILDLMEVAYEEQPVVCGFVPDFLVGSDKIIECDGVYWHGLDHIKKRDIRKNAAYKQHGYRVLRVTDLDIMNDSGRTFTKVWRFLCM